MTEERKLWKTTIEIVTDYDPTNTLEIEDLAREATSGEAYCIRQTTEPIYPSNLEDGCREFFNCNEDAEE